MTTAEFNNYQALLTQARKTCHKLIGAPRYQRSVREVNGIKYDMLCKKETDGTYYAEVYLVYDDECDDFTFCDTPFNNALYQFSHNDLK
jgi:hypothetical protein